MEPLRTEEDQIRALKQWWDENGVSTLTGLALAVAIVVGWQWWQQRTVLQAEQAAVLYRQLLQATQLAATDDVQRTTAETLAKQLKTEQAGRRQGDYGALILARLMVEKQDLAAAEKELRAIVARQPESISAIERRVRSWLGRYKDPQLGALARLRLARVLFAMDRPDDALTVLKEADSAYFAADKAELRGDILRLKGDLAAAQKAYAEAAGESGQKPVGLLDLKQQEVAALAAASKSAEPAAAAPIESEDKP